MRNKLSDLNNHLFEQLERLNDEELTGEELKNEIARSKSISTIAMAIINGGSLMLKAKQYTDEFGDDGTPDILKLTNK